MYSNQKCRKLAYLPRSTPKPGPMGGNRPHPASKLQQGTYFYLKTIINLSQTLFVKTKLATIHHCMFALAQGLPTSLPGTEPLQKARKFKTTFSPYNFYLVGFHCWKGRWTIAHWFITGAPRGRLSATWHRC